MMHSDFVLDQFNARSRTHLKLNASYHNLVSRALRPSPVALKRTHRTSVRAILFATR